MCKEGSGQAATECDLCRLVQPGCSKQKPRICSGFFKPSDGVEPSTVETSPCGVVSPLYVALPWQLQASRATSRHAKRPQNLSPTAASDEGSHLKGTCVQGFCTSAAMARIDGPLLRREVLGYTNFDNKNPRFAGILEPSDGLEPSTPSLP